MITINILTAAIVVLYTSLGVMLIKKNPSRILSLLLAGYTISAVITSKISKWYSFSLLIPLVYYSIFLQITQNIIKHLERPRINYRDDMRVSRNTGNTKRYRMLVFVLSFLSILIIPVVLEIAPFGGVLLWFIILLAPLGVMWSMLAEIDEFELELEHISKSIDQNHEMQEPGGDNSDKIHRKQILERRC
ncbi:hypothetical protein [Thermococcus sp.]|uniref:hypothetical protein n=1 Tax=Thermococcus sp. TaxID=35749 RepID=UPI0025F8A186|nr:hypothetical protein [Thermococcus sp.]